MSVHKPTIEERAAIMRLLDGPSRGRYSVAVHIGCSPEQASYSLQCMLKDGQVTRRKNRQWHVNTSIKRRFGSVDNYIERLV